MTMRIIKVTIKDGKMQIDFEGFRGQSCFRERETIETLLQSLGISTQVENIRKKAEADVSETVEL